MEEVLIVCLYVDDLIYTSNSQSLIDEFRQSMINGFEMTDLGAMNYFLGLEVKQCDDGIFISHEKYVMDLLEKFRMKDCNPMQTPMNIAQGFTINDGPKKADSHVYRSLVGSLLYFTHTLPDIMQATSLLSRFMQSPSRIHYGTAKWALTPMVFGIQALTILNCLFFLIVIGQVLLMTAKALLVTFSILGLVPSHGAQSYLDEKDFG